MFRILFSAIVLLLFTAAAARAAENVPGSSCSGYTANSWQWAQQGGFPVERAALGSCDLSVLRIGDEWQWLVRRDGRDVAEGAARAAADAKREAEAVALKLGF